MSTSVSACAVKLAKPRVINMFGRMTRRVDRIGLVSLVSIYFMIVIAGFFCDGKNIVFVSLILEVFLEVLFFGIYVMESYLYK